MDADDSNVMGRAQDAGFCASSGSDDVQGKVELNSSQNIPLLTMLFASSFWDAARRQAAFSIRVYSRWAPNSGSFITPQNVKIVASAESPLPSTSCIIEIGQRDLSKPNISPRVYHADGQPLRISLSNGTDLRRCIGLGLQLAAQFKANSDIAFSFENQHVSDSDAATLGEVVTVHSYSPSTWKKAADATPKTGVQTCTVLGASAHAVQLGCDIGAAINMARRLGDLPPNIATPAFMAAQAVQLCEASQSSGSIRLTCTVLDEAECARLGMNLLLAVGSGSSNPPRVIALEHCPPGLEGTQPVLLVGKGVTFDSGGISLKPSAKMEVCYSFYFSFVRTCQIHHLGNEMGHVRSSDRCKIGQRTLHHFLTLV
jgi:hypothetical protein